MRSRNINKFWMLSTNSNAEIVCNWFGSNSLFFFFNLPTACKKPSDTPKLLIDGLSSQGNIKKKRNSHHSRHLGVLPNRGKQTEPPRFSLFPRLCCQSMLEPLTADICFDLRARILVRPYRFIPYFLTYRAIHFE